MMNINYRALGSNVWETVGGIGLVGVGLLMINELRQASTATGFSARSLSGAGGGIGLIATTWLIFLVVETIFHQLDERSHPVSAANFIFSAIASVGIARAGSQGNQTAAYITTCYAVCAAGMAVLAGLMMTCAGLRGSYDAVVHP